MRRWPLAPLWHPRYTRRLCFGTIISLNRGDGDMSDLASKTCVPCKGGVPPLAGAELAQLVKEVPDWQVVDGHHLTRSFKFPNFLQALAFVNKVGEIAEGQGHHPDILLTWGKAEITTWTHKINGLTESDFILAAKIDRL
jgi:4a-hydroxytetrahydrobiopterin dehydratase